ncbi:MAG: hypothetical protein ACRCZS_11450 [Chroococcidiopsis sp.]
MVGNPNSAAQVTPLINLVSLVTIINKNNVQTREQRSAIALTFKRNLESHFHDLLADKCDPLCLSAPKTVGADP